MHETFLTSVITGGGNWTSVLKALPSVDQFFLDLLWLVRKFQNPVMGEEEGFQVRLIWNGGNWIIVLRALLSVDQVFSFIS